MEPRSKITGKEILSCKNISKSYPTPEGEQLEVLRDVSFCVEENEFLVLFGPGQCGKTTLLNILSGQEMPDGGQVFMEGKAVSEPNETMGMVYQRTSLFPWLTVFGNVSFGPKMRKLPKEELERKAEKYIDLVGLAGFEKHFPSQLSGGMQQRVGIARAYCNEPRILFMDEPFGHLDAQTRYKMEEDIDDIAGKEKRTIVFVTNNLEEAIYLADRIIVLTNCPTTVKKEYVVKIPKPRRYTDPDFLALRKEIMAQSDISL